MRGIFVFRRDTPLLDAGARGDPFVRRFHHFFQIVVGQDFRRHIRAHSHDGTTAALEIMICPWIFKFHLAGDYLTPLPAVRPFNFSFAFAISVAIISFTWCGNDPAVTRMALATARSRAEACALNTIPLKPSNGAPP